MLLVFLVLFMPAITRCEVSLPELEFLVGQMSFGECQHLADALRADSTASNVEGVTCLDELIRLHYALKSEGPNIARGIFKHKLNQIGRRDLAQWLSIDKDPEVLSQSKNGVDEEEHNPIEGKTGPLETSKRSTSWCEVAVTIALLYTGALLVWLTIRVILCKMKKHFRDKGLTSGGYGYSYYQAPQQWSPNEQCSPQYAAPCGQNHHHHHHHHHPTPTIRPLTTTTSQPQMTRYDKQ